MPRSFPLVFCAGLLAMACDGRSQFANPTAPSQVLSPVRGPVSTPTYTVSGVVRARGNVPVAGARVVALSQGSSVTTTDGHGHYSLPDVRASSLDGLGPLLSASKSGYFTDVRFAAANYAPISNDTQLDFELDPSVAISLGEVIQGRAPVGDPVCSHWGYGSGACQRFALTVPSPGTLDVTLSAPVFNFDFDIVNPDGTFAIYSAIWVSPLHVTIPVEAGSTYELRVIGGWSPPRDFELTTALR